MMKIFLRLATSFILITILNIFSFTPITYAQIQDSSGPYPTNGLSWVDPAATSVCDVTAFRTDCSYWPSPYWPWDDPKTGTECCIANPDLPNSQCQPIIRCDLQLNLDGFNRWSEFYCVSPSLPTCPADSCLACTLTGSPDTCSNNGSQVCTTNFLNSSPLPVPPASSSCISGTITTYNVPLAYCDSSQGAQVCSIDACLYGPCSGGICPIPTPTPTNTPTPTGIPTSTPTPTPTSTPTGTPPPTPTPTPACGTYNNCNSCVFAPSGNCGWATNPSATGLYCVQGTSTCPAIYTSWYWFDCSTNQCTVPTPTPTPTPPPTP